MNSKERTGQQFDHLTVQGRAGTSACGHAIWRCECRCGNVIDVSSNQLVTKKTRSCGCLVREMAEQRVQHGDARKGSHTRLYKIWTDMKARCFNSQSAKYADYGGRGISVCDEWAAYTAFKDWALANGYDETLTLDRRDVNQGYNPQNCRFVDWEVQANNKRNSHYITLQGDTKTISQWAKLFGVSINTVQNRLKRGCPVDTLFTPPSRIKRGTPPSGKGFVA